MTDEVKGEAADPVRKWTLILLGVAAFMMIWYVIADRVTPYTSQARVHALIVPVAPQVSGYVTEVAISSNRVVTAGDLLFRIDRRSYELAVETAEANLQAARQATGASGANVEVARAQLKAAEAGLVKAEQDAVRMRRIKEEDPGAISERRLQMAEATYEVAVSQVSAAQANLERALQDFGADGDDNSRILEAQSALEKAQLDLDRTAVVAPADGVVTDVRVDRGNFASAGAPLMTFLASHDIWVQADFTENNLGNIKAGDPVRIVFDAMPGQVVSGKIRTTGFGVSVDTAPLGSLPTIDNQRDWLRDEQRFAVVVDFELPNREDRRGIRVGAQASVIVLTGSNFLFNAWARLKMRVVSWLTYVY